MKKKRAAGEWMRLGAALAFLADHGISLTGPGLRRVGGSHGFSKQDKEGKWWFRVEDLRAYVVQAKSRPPEGWITVAQAAKLAKVTIVTIYNWMAHYHLETKRVGPRRGSCLNANAIIEIRDKLNTEDAHGTK